MDYRAKGKIYILPMARISKQVIDAVVEGLKREFHLEAEVLDEVPLPVDSYNTDRQQYLSIIVIEEIALMDLKGLVLAIAGEDLYAQGLNFVFGEADPEKGITVISLARLGQEFYGGSPDPERLTERTVKEAVHEVGHIMGISHCPNPECVMRYSNTLSHTDRKSSELCPLCKRKLSLLSHL
jgi:archaemetzincin